MSKKNSTRVNNQEVSNLEGAAMQPTEQPQAEFTPIVEPKQELSAVDEAAAELEALKAKMAEAKAKLAAAKKANTKSRPVRLNTFVVLVCQDKAYAYAAIGEEMFKSDVHYCAEKAAIDVLAEDLKVGQANNYVYAIVKRSKSVNEAGEPETEKVVSLLYIDAETQQIVID